MILLTFQGTRLQLYYNKTLARDHRENSPPQRFLVHFDSKMAKSDDD